MIIKKAECWVHAMPLKEPYSIATLTTEVAHNVFIRLETDSPHVGFGVAAPAKEVTGETCNTVTQTLNAIVFPALLGEPFDRAGNILRSLERELEAHPTARAGTEIATFDLFGKIAGLPVYKIFGAQPKSVDISITVGVMPLPDTLERVKRHLQEGFKTLKLKGGKNWEEDVEKVRKVREVSGDSLAILFDANQGYQLEEATKFIRAVEKYGLSIIEQPIAEHQKEGLVTLAQQSPVPIMLDESMKTESDARYFRGKGLNHLNIKLMKVGGMIPAKSILNLLDSSTPSAMIGCMDESALGIAAALHLALASPQMRYADLDGHIGLMNDPANLALTLRNGALFPSDQPGFGVKLENL